MIEIIKVAGLDVAGVQSLRAESLREGFKFVERLCEEWASGVNQFSARGEALFQAVVGGHVVGVCGLNRDPYAHEERAGRVRRLYVLPGHRRAGVGCALLRAVIVHARGHFDLLRVRTDQADGFYVAQGFRRDISGGDATHVLELLSAD
jgi:GNAT superfamily N-acetyltransferase